MERGSPFRRWRLEPDGAAEVSLRQQLHTIGPDSSALAFLGAEGTLKNLQSDIFGQHGY